MIEQEPFCGVRTHFYHNASWYDMFRDRTVVENSNSLCYVEVHGDHKFLLKPFRKIRLFEVPKKEKWLKKGVCGAQWKWGTSGHCRLRWDHERAEFLRV